MTLGTFTSRRSSKGAYSTVNPQGYFSDDFAFLHTEWYSVSC